MNTNQYDVIIIGGSFAGLSAALCLGRALKKVAIIDGGKPCNRYAPESHNFLGNDGVNPSEFTKKALGQILEYKNVTYISDVVIGASGKDEAFSVDTEKSGRLLAKKLLFATGVRDEIPPIEGFEACWGNSIIHCPYCHGYEFVGKKTGVLSSDKMTKMYVKMISGWANEIVLFTNNADVSFSQEDFQDVDAKITIINSKIQSVSHEDGHIQFVNTDEDKIPINVLYSHLPMKLHCDIPVKIFGCETSAPFGLLKVDQQYKTSVDGIYAAGDTADFRRSLAMATFTGQIAAVAANHSILKLVH